MIGLEHQAEHVAELTPELEIVVLPEPVLHVTRNGDMSETDAAIYLSHRMYRTLTGVSVRTLQRWRTHKIGPVYHKAPGAKAVWYRIADLDDWIALSCAVDPLAKSTKYHLSRHSGANRNDRHRTPSRSGTRRPDCHVVG